ncbi:MAG: hypothetical protein HQM10_12975 [Candidatus Riflebacteria bacterium]|nr:hypothetical protein [Candidatus Riflebacteria bacterium]
MLGNSSKPASGFVLGFLVILFPIILFLAAFIHSSIVKTRYLFRRIDQNDLLERLSESCSNEAFAQFSKNVSIKDSPEFMWILDQASSSFEVETPFAQTLIQNTEKKLGKFSIRNIAQIKSFRNCDWDKTPYSIEKREGEGVLEILTHVELRKPDGQTFQRKILRNHDYKVCAFASPEKEDSIGYNRPFVLHYAFLSRIPTEKIDNTQDYAGFSKLKIVKNIDVNGKLFFGGNTSFDEELFDIDSETISLNLFFSPSGKKISSTAFGKNGFKPFSGVSLFSRRFPSQEEFYKSDLFDAASNKFVINCMIQIGGNFVIGKSAIETSHEGVGLIVADSITIEGSVRKNNPSDILILFAKNGAIKIETESMIEAALIAVNDNLSGEITARGTFSVFGCLVADKINIKNRSIGTSQLIYDPVFSPKKTRLCVSLIPWVTFQLVQDSQIK